MSELYIGIEFSAPIDKDMLGNFTARALTSLDAMCATDRADHYVALPERRSILGEHIIKMRTVAHHAHVEVLFLIEGPQDKLLSTAGLRLSPRRVFDPEVVSRQLGCTINITYEGADCDAVNVVFENGQQVV